MRQNMLSQANPEITSYFQKTTFGDISIMHAPLPVYGAQKQLHLIVSGSPATTRNTNGVETSKKVNA
jgi:hypothetical protein